MDIEFIQQNWHLFAALAVIMALLALDPLRRHSEGIQSVSAVQLPQLMNHEYAIVLDVSEPAEFKKGHIPKAINMPVSQLKNDLGRLEKYRTKDTPIVLSSRANQHANRAAAILRKNNFSNL
ncbi:MAG: rhodanese-like domain-containing protein, partial [Methylococcales bacterium]|nr:rhodanese-like domain-containing protein [Methylococcales bacterium]